MIDITYVTASPYKREEIKIIAAEMHLADGRTIGEVFNFVIREVSIKEHLEVDLPTLVMAEVANAYSQLKVPCIVEHAGLIFDRHYDRGYPGGLTKPMWDVLRDDFVRETASSGERAAARACVAYCDGSGISTYLGETKGRIADAPRGERQFYWDTIFVPDNPDPDADPDLTYAEIVAHPALGLRVKLRLSQSTKAMLAFLNYRLDNSPPLWPDS